MTVRDLEIVLGWAEAEGWNPGREDAEHFRAADPEGFLVALDGGEPASSVSVVRVGPRHAFLGLYICRSDLRGRGFGSAIWRAGMDRVRGFSVGLDGVVAQQPAYERAGFVRQHATLRHAGRAAGGREMRSRPIAPADLDAALALDRRATGFDRPAFLGRWFAPAPDRHVRVIGDAAHMAIGVMRACATGWKIGPLHADDPAQARDMLADLVAQAGPSGVMIDVPEANAAALSAVREIGLEPVFETARMWTGDPPAADAARGFAVATLELG